MLDRELVREIKAAIATVKHVTTLPDADARRCIEMLASTHRIDGSRKWWWEALGVPHTRLSYGTADGISELRKLVPPDDTAVLIATDDSPPPWLVVRGSVRDLLAVLNKCRFFEFALAADDGRWIVFDTHMNELLISGDTEIAR